MKVNLIDHNDIGWERTIAITYQGKSYLINLSWARGEGYEIKGFDKLPENLRNKYGNEYESEYEFASELDEATHNKAYNKEEASE